MKKDLKRNRVFGVEKNLSQKGDSPQRHLSVQYCRLF